MTLYISVGLIVILVVGLCYYFYIKKKKQLRKNIEKVTEKEKVIEKIQLMAVRRLDGSSPIGNKETDEEVRARLATLNRDEFILLDLQEKPFSAKEWGSLKSYEEIEERSAYELSMCYAYNHDGTVNKERSEILYREFESYK